MKKIILMCLIILAGCAAPLPQNGNTIIDREGNRKVEVEGMNDPLENSIKVTTYNYDYYAPPMPLSSQNYRVVIAGTNDPFLRAFIDKKTNTESISLYVIFREVGGFNQWDVARFEKENELINLNANRVSFEADCGGGLCTYLENSVLSITREILEDWSISGKTIRFGSSKSTHTQDVYIGADECRLFLDKLNEIKNK